MAIGLPFASPGLAVGAGVTPINRSPAVTRVVVSLMLRVTCVSFLASFSINPQPYSAFILVTQAVASEEKPGCPMATLPFHFGSARSDQDFGASSGLISFVL